MGEAISGQIATAFSKTNTPWNSAMKAIGIVGVVVAVLIRVLLREPARRSSLIQSSTENLIDQHPERLSARLASAKFWFLSTLSYLLRLRSFWLLTLCSGARQLSGNVFGSIPQSFPEAIKAKLIRILHAWLSYCHLSVGD